MTKKNKVERLTLPDYQTYSKVTVTKTVWYCYKDRQSDQRAQKYALARL